MGIPRLKRESEIISGNVLKIKAPKSGLVKFAVLSDTHLGSRYEQLEELKDFYKICKKEKVKFAIHAGDLSEGSGKHYKGQLFELKIIGEDEQKSYIIANYPRANFPTYILSGGHDLDYFKDEGSDLIKNICQLRKDLVYLGQYDAFLHYGPIKIYVIHPDGGSSQAISHQPQKIVDGFSEGEKPDIAIIGHYHKAEFIPSYKNIHIIQAGCFQYKTPFARRKRLSWHNGGWIIQMEYSNNSITSLTTKFISNYA